MDGESQVENAVDPSSSISNVLLSLAVPSHVESEIFKRPCSVFPLSWQRSFVPATVVIPAAANAVFIYVAPASL